MANHEELWNEVCERIKNSGLIHTTIFVTWIKSIERAKFGERILYLWTPNYLVQNSIKERYVTIITDAAYKVTKKSYRLCVLLTGQIEPSEDELLKDEIKIAHEEIKVNENYTFENFIVGKSNRFAHAYALTAAEVPGKDEYNPLFLYGGSGLGKTHLCHAMVNFLRTFSPEKKVIYVSAETYTNEFIASLREKRTDTFKEKYRSADILIIDDIQFISGKASTQEEFFHTFNALYDNKKQIVLTSDLPPHEVSDIEERLVTRFSSGLILDITPPDFETRIAILQKKAEKEGLELSEEVYVYIAENFDSNIRELEGAINKIAAYKKIVKETNFDESKAEEILKNMMYSRRETVYTYKMILSAVAEYFHITVDNLLGTSKRREYVTPRQISMYLCSEKVQGATSVTIGKEFERDHSTVLYGISKIENDYEKNPKVRQMIDDILNILEKD